MRNARSRKSLVVEQLEDRTNPDAHPIAAAAAAGYRVGELVVTLDTRADELVVGLPGGAAALAPLVTVGGPLAGMSAARWLTPELVVLAGSVDRVADAAAAPGVTFAAPVYQNPDTGGWLVATNEVIVALAPGADASALADPRFSSWVPLSGTPDQFVVKAAAGYGAAAFDLAESLHGDPRFAWAAPNFYQDVRKYFTPNDTLYASQWHLNNTVQQAGQLAGADVDAPLAWDVTQGSQNVIVSVVDDGMEMIHPDLAPNIAINQGEIPAAVLAVLTDVDGDGTFSFLDLNNAVNIGAVGSNKAVDVNANGRIDPDDILASAASGGWVNSLDGDSNGYMDDLCGWDFTTNGAVGDNNPGADGVNDAHATSVAGVAVGVGNNNLGTAGIAFRSRMLPVRIFGTTGAYAGDANTASAVYYAAGRTRDGSGTFRAGDVMNNSWGGGSPSPAITAAFTWASANGRAGKGVPSFISSGNDFDDAVSYPSNLAGTITGVISVGASTDVDTRSSYSNYGTQLDFVAPSSGPSFGGAYGIVTTDRTAANGYNTAAGTAGNYTNTLASGFGGTSSASPLAAGIGALVLAADPNLTALQVRTLMRATTELIGPNVNAAGFAVGFGYGKVNANAAVRGVGVAEVQVLDDRANVAAGTGSASFGSVGVGGVGATRTFRVRNQGTQTLTLGAVSVSGPFEIVSGLSSSSLTTNQYATFSVRFLPTAAGAGSGTVTFTNNDLNEGTFDFTVTGTGVTPSLAGRPYEDWAGNGAADANDPSLAGRQVFLDLNGNGSHDTALTPVAFSSGTISVAVPDATGAVATHAQTVSGTAGLVSKVTVRVSITHTYDADLSVELVGPTGQSVMLFAGRGGAGDNLTNTLFDDAGGTWIGNGAVPFTGTFRPEEALSAFNGTAANGAWTLRVRDSAGGDVGTITSWTLTLTLAEPTQTTTAAGTYAFAGLPAATYTVRTVVPAGWTSTGPAGGAYSQALAAGGSVTGLDFGSVQQNAVYGQMVNDLNGNGVRDGGEPVMAGWRVFDDRDNDGVLDGGEVNALTDASGNYVLPGVTAGATTIRVERQAGYRTTLGVAGLPLTVATNATYHTRDFGAVADAAAPTADVTDVTPDPRTSPVSSVVIVFGESVSGFDLSDLSLTRSGGGNLLTGSQTLTTSDSITWTLGNLTGLTAATGTYLLTLTAGGSGVQDAAQNALAANAADTWVVIPVPTVSVSDATVGEGGGPAVFTVTLSSGSPDTVQVPYSTADGTATVADNDYTATTGTLTFAPGETMKTVSVPITSDLRDEPDETFVLNLGAPTNATVGDGQGIATITDDDPTPSLTINSVTLAEGNSGNTAFAFTVTLSAVSGRTVTVGYATANGAATTADGDYTATSGTLTFGPGETTKTVTVQATGDVRDEADETFAVNLSGATNATIGTATGTGTITDDDPVPSLSIGSVTLAEGTGSTTPFAFTVTLSAVSGRTVTVAYATADGSATTTDGDYTATSGTLTFAPGETTKTVTVQVTGDARNETNESFTLGLSGASNATLGTGTGTGTIANDDLLPVLTIGSASRPEGNSGSTPFAFAVTLSAASGRTVTVDYATANGTATTADGDYTATSGTLTFAPGETTKSVTVQAAGDARNEADETFSVELSGATNATLGTATGTGTVTNDDPLPTLGVNSVSLAEGTGGTTAFAFTIALSAVSGRTVTVAYSTADGTATVTDGDYTAASGTLTFTPGETTKTVTVQATGDVRNEIDETFAFGLSAPTNAGLAAGTGTATLVNDDPLPVMTIASASAVEGATGGTALTFTVSLSAASGRTVSVNYATANGNATVADGDYTAASGTLTFAPGDTTKTIAVTLAGDLRNEIDETFAVNLSGAANATVGLAVGTGTLLNDDPEPTLSVDSVTAPEGLTGPTGLTFTVTLSAVSGRTVTVNYSTANGTAAAGSDYTAASGTLTFAPGETTKTITMTAAGDYTFEPDETFTLTLDGATNASVAAGTGTGTIVNDDSEPTAALSYAGGAVAETGAVATVVVTLSNPSYLPVTVSFALGGAATATDYVAPPASVTIPAGQLSAAVTITARDDADDEPDEPVTLALDGVVNGTANGGPVAVTIVDDDVPVAAAAAFDLTEDVPFTAPTSLLATANAQPGSVVELVGPAPTGGTLTLNPAGTFAYTSAADVNGTVGFNYRVRNPAGEVSAPASVTLRVAAVNDPPAFAAGPDQTDPRRSGPQVVPTWATAIAAGPPDEAGQRLTFEVGNDNPALFAVQPAIDPATGTLTYASAGGFGTAVVTVRLRDDAGGADASPARTFVITLLKYRDDNTPTNQDEVGLIGVGSGDGGTVAAFRGDGAAEGTMTAFVGAAARVVTADVTGDGVADTIVATGPGVRSRVVVIDGATGAVARTILPFEDTFTGGLFVAAADVDGDGKAEIAVSPDTGGGGRVTVFGAGGPMADYFGIDDPSFRGGARVAFGDVNGDGTPDLVVAAGFGGGPRVAVYDGTTLTSTPARLVNDFFAFPGSDAVNLRNGVFVAAGDVDGDGYADLAFGGGPGGAPRVFVLSGALVSAGKVAGAQAAPVGNFFVANNSTDRGGVRVAVKDADGDDRADVAAGSGEGVAARVRVYPGAAFGAGGEPGGFFDLEPFGGAVLAGGVFVG